MSQLGALKTAKSLSDVAKLLEIDPSHLSYVLYFLNKTSPLYTTFDVPKRHGGKRTIDSPHPSLKRIQRSLSLLLQNCVAEINQARISTKGHNNNYIAHGFRRKHSIITNARVHITRRYVFNLDLHDFFGSINFGRIRGFFLKDRNFSLHPKVATVLAQIACYQGKLPQGSPCSPAISNLIGHLVDIPLAQLAKRSGCTYTRYADDLTFSCNKSKFPTSIGVQDQLNNHVWLPGDALKKIIQKSGFKFNESKTRMQYRDSRQEVTGLIVNRKVNVPAPYRHKVRSLVHALFTTGKFEHIYKKNDSAGDLATNKIPGNKNELLGMLSYIDQVDLFNKKLCLENKAIPVNTEGRSKLYRRLLYFCNFYSASKPIIVCEGKTDNIYIKQAIIQLSPLYPRLATSTPTSVPVLNVNFFKHPDKRTRSREVMEIGDGGTPGLCKMIKNYHGDLEKFLAPPPKYPVIILIDNDQGAKSIYKLISGIKKVEVTGLEDFVHVCKNLYVVSTPLIKSLSMTDMEDFFDEETLNTPLNDKAFKKSMNGEDNEKHYGKYRFACEVVIQKSNSTDFSGFSGILTRLTNAIEDYTSKLSTTITPT